METEITPDLAPLFYFLPHPSARHGRVKGQIARFRGKFGPFLCESVDVLWKPLQVVGPSAVSTRQRVNGLGTHHA
jgi:hypothetical protein